MAAAYAGPDPSLTPPAGQAIKPKKSGKSKTAKTVKAARTAQADKAAGGSGELPADRSARLKRECRDAVNAGACSGYAP